MKRLFPLSLLLLLLISLACASSSDPRSGSRAPVNVFAPATDDTLIPRGVSSAIQVDSEKIIHVNLRGTTVTVTPWRTRVESPDQEIIWVPAHPTWTVDIEFKHGTLPKPCPAPAPRCGKRFPAGRPGLYEYDVILTTPKGTYRVDPELEIRY